MKLQIYLMVALPTVAALIAAGMVLFLKIERRSEPPSDAREVANAVPVVPLAEQRAAAWKRRYAATVALVLAALAAFAVWLWSA